jgi:hypothetical protein
LVWAFNKLSFPEQNLDTVDEKAKCGIHGTEANAILFINNLMASLLVMVLPSQLVLCYSQHLLHKFSISIVWGICPS